MQAKLQAQTQAHSTNNSNILCIFTNAKEVLWYLVADILQKLV
jgi:hypothetical protein